ncbi:indolepyruvate oxidoreductase subunit beta [Chloroflexota bacterium]
MKEPLNLIIVGVGGQGNVTISGLIGRALLKQGYHITIGELYGAAQRGGSVMSHVRISVESEFGPIIPEGRADVVLGLEPVESLRVLGAYGNPGVEVIANTRPIYPIAVAAGDIEYPTLERIHKALIELSHHVWFINATDIALGLGTAVLTNVVMVGALVTSRLTPLTQKAFVDEIKNAMPQARIEDNLKAFEEGAKALSSYNLEYYR